jgi:hypothetical protein
MILDGGACDVGIESTVLSLVDKPILLRAGGVPKPIWKKLLARFRLRRNRGRPPHARRARHDRAPLCAARAFAFFTSPEEIALAGKRNGAILSLTNKLLASMKASSCRAMRALCPRFIRHLTSSRFGEVRSRVD